MKHPFINCTLIRLALSRRDDLESMMYVLIYLQKGSLPWQGLDISDTDEKTLRIYKIKRRTLPEKLCEGLEPEFVECMKYVRNLTYTEKPDYKKIKQLFRDLYARKGFVYDNIYQWDKVVELNAGLKRKLEKKELLEAKEKDAEKKPKKKSKKNKSKKKKMAENKDEPKVEKKDNVKTFKQIQTELTAVARLQAEQEKKMKTKNQAELTALAAQQAECEKIMKSQFFNRPLFI